MDAVGAGKLSGPRFAPITDRRPGGDAPQDRLERGTVSVQQVCGIQFVCLDGVGSDLRYLNSSEDMSCGRVTRLLDGDRAPAIAAELFLTQGTVRNHLASIFSKVGVSSQQQLLTLFRAARASRR